MATEGKSQLKILRISYAFLQNSRELFFENWDEKGVRSD